MTILLCGLKFEDVGYETQGEAVKEMHACVEQMPVTWDPTGVF